MADERTAKPIGVDELVQSITTATLRALKSELPATDFSDTGLYVHFRVYCGMPRADVPPPQLPFSAATRE
jgi:hypothetical protein